MRAGSRRLAAGRRPASGSAAVGRAPVRRRGRRRRRGDVVTGARDGRDRAVGRGTRARRGRSGGRPTPGRTHRRSPGEPGYGPNASASRAMSAAWPSHGRRRSAGIVTASRARGRGPAASCGRSVGEGRPVDAPPSDRASVRRDERGARRRVRRSGTAGAASRRPAATGGATAVQRWSRTSRRAAPGPVGGQQVRTDRMQRQAGHATRRTRIGATPRRPAYGTSSPSSLMAQG